MARQPIYAKPTRPKPPKAPRSPQPSFPQHETLSAPFARLQTIGNTEDLDAYKEIVQSFAPKDIPMAVDKLTTMVLDETYAEYNDPLAKDTDPRYFTPLHALNTLAEFGPAAASAMEPLFPLFDSENDDLREELPYFFGAVGAAAMEPLTALLLDRKAETYVRDGAGDGLVEIAEQHPEQRARVIALLEQALMTERDDEELVAYLVCDLMDLGSQESVPLIEQAYKEDRVDWEVVQMADVEEHFGLPRVTPYREYDYLDDDDEPDAASFGEKEDLFADEDPGNLLSADDEDDEERQEPYVAPAKVGRNEPCPCGSGKKYKKCHGA